MPGLENSLGIDFEHVKFFYVIGRVFHQAAASEPVSQGPGCTLGKADSSSAKGSNPMGVFMGFTVWGMLYITKDWVFSGW